MKYEIEYARKDKLDIKTQKINKEFISKLCPLKLMLCRHIKSIESKRANV